MPLELFDRIRAAMPEPLRLSDDDFAKLVSWLASHRLWISLADRSAGARAKCRADREWREHLRSVVKYNTLIREAVAAGAPTAVDPPSTTENRAEPPLPERARVALNQYAQAVEASGRNKLTDPEAYEYLTGVYEKARADGDTTDELLEFGTWRRYLSEARRLTGAQKHQPRTGRGKSRSIVKRSEV
jgi:hypothetical protein